MTFARKSGGGLRRDAEADRLWRGAYEDELSVDRYGLAGAACSRAEAHVLRLSMLYALLDQSDVIRVEHVNAALAMWRYCEQSTVLLFGDRLGDPVADAIVEELATAGEAGRTRSELRDLFGRNRTAAELDLALGVLEDQGRITSESEKTGGRPATRYRLVDKDKGATDEPPFPRTARDRP